MTTTLVALVAFPQTTPVVLVVDLFAPEEPSKPSHRKRPCTDDDPDTMRLHVGLTEEQELELVMR